MTLPLQDPLLSAEGQGQPSHRTGFFRTVLRERKSAVIGDRKSTRLNSSHSSPSRMPSSA